MAIDRSVPAAAVNAGPTIGSYVDTFGPMPPWPQLCDWPPDVFALANLVLDDTEAYRFAVAPPPGRIWPPTATWNDDVTGAARAWRASAGQESGEPGTPPPAVQSAWEVVTRFRDEPLSRAGEERWELWSALVTMQAIADEACADLALAGIARPESDFEQQAWTLLDRHGSLSRLSPRRVRILPKTHVVPVGITARSFSRYLALSYEAVEVSWHRLHREAGVDATGHGPRDYRALLVPWPLVVHAEDFRPVAGPLENMEATTFGFFEFGPRESLDLDLLVRLIRSARRVEESIDVVILPEAAVRTEEIAGIERVLADHDVLLLVTGVREGAEQGALGRNYIHIGVRTTDGWTCFEQSKHHRWLLEGNQVRQYHLSRMLDPAKQWWEAIQLPPRQVQVVDFGAGASAVPLICEDLARMDEVTDLLRRMGPCLVVALLLDGPQLAGRWPCRYAGVLADEPGSAVLTLTSLGMATRSRPPGMARSRVVGMWHDPTTGLHELELARGAAGILIHTSLAWRTTWTADGRRQEERTPEAVLAGVHQLRR
jgi:hypothetical protein